MSQRDPEQKELKHEAVPGYRPVFIAIFALFVVYMIIIFTTSGPGTGGH